LVKGFVNLVDYSILNVMKKAIPIILMILCSLIILGQKPVTISCKVLMESISEEYEGECKKNLAHGKGIAKGVDTYEGEFKKGWPHGEGIYTWASGDVYEGNWKSGQRDGKGTLTINLVENDSIIDGYWKDDKYIGEKQRATEYKILEREGIDRVNFYKVDETLDEIEIHFYRLGSNLVVDNLFYHMTTGSESTTFIGYKDVEFPVECMMTYTISNAYGYGTINCRFSFEIYVPGKWEIEVHH
jgi:hypothetical protein